MTSKTARTNARLKVEAQARREALYDLWKAMLAKNGDDWSCLSGEKALTDEARALGGTEAELKSFIWQFAG